MLDLELMKSVAEQMMAGGKVEAGGRTWFVKRTSSQRLKTVRFEIGGREYQAIEQNPQKPSRESWRARDTASSSFATLLPGDMSLLRLMGM